MARPADLSIRMYATLKAIVESDHAQAKEQCDGDWEGMSYEALHTIREALAKADAIPTPHASGGEPA